MALKSVAILSWADSGYKQTPGFGLNWVVSLRRTRKWASFCGFSGAAGVGAKPATGIGRVVDQKQNDVSRRLNKDVSSLPKPLSGADLSAISDCSSKVRISFKGVSGSYSEDAARKAYPKCETVPCDEFEDAFKVVELWLADKAVLPIESSSGGSIHRNYDLLLRHRLHIVGEVQLAVNFCLLALPGIRVDQLKRVLSHAQVKLSFPGPPGPSP